MYKRPFGLPVFVYPHPSMGKLLQIYSPLYCIIIQHSSKKDAAKIAEGNISNIQKYSMG